MLLQAEKCLVQNKFNNTCNRDIMLCAKSVYMQWGLCGLKQGVHHKYLLQLTHLS